MTYDRLKIDDEPLLDILLAARDGGAMLCAHAENHGIISWMVKRLLARGYTDPKYHAISHARVSEAEAFNRLIGMAALIDQPIMIFHVSTAEGAKVIRDARGQGLKVFAETCPQYLFLTADDLDKPGVEGAKWMCSPPPRRAADQEALWQALALGDLQTVSSDHAPYRFDETGKLRAGPNPNFKQVANGLPGLEVRLPLLFDAMVSGGPPGARKIRRTDRDRAGKDLQSASAQGLDRGRRRCRYRDLGPGARGHAERRDDARSRPATRRSPAASCAAGRSRCYRAGASSWRTANVRSKRAPGRFLARTGGEAAKPTGRLMPDMDPEQNFGARLL